MKMAKFKTKVVLTLAILSLVIWIPQITKGKNQNINSSACNNGLPEVKVVGIPNRISESSNLKSISPLATDVFKGLFYCTPDDPFSCNNYFEWPAVQTTPGFPGVVSFRDIFVGAAQTISNPTNGEFWNAQWTLPNGSQIQSGSVGFFQTLNGQQNCFRYPDGSMDCNVTYITLYWITPIQCAPTGLWKVDLADNGSIFSTSQFYLRPRLEKSIYIYNQTDAAWQGVPYDHICHNATNTTDYSQVIPCLPPISSTLKQWSLGDQGCGLFSLVSVLGYHGISTAPTFLNDWLIANSGYFSSGSIDVRKVVEYANTQVPNKISIVGQFPQDDSSLISFICSYGPVIIDTVGSPTHVVAASGRSDDNTSFIVADPIVGGERRLSDPPYLNFYSRQVVLSGPEHLFTNKSGLAIEFFSPVEAFITDPLGRRTGIDPRVNANYNEIPVSVYSKSPIGDHNKNLDITRPIDGEYTLTVVGTGTGTYSSEMRAYDADGNLSSPLILSNVATAPGIVNVYKLNFSQLPGSQLNIIGGFDGGGQREDVDQFLTYANPTASSTTLPTGTTSYSLVILYGKTTIPTSFKADLNGKDVTSLFSPQPGSVQVVNIPLQPGSNVLKLSIDGIVTGGRVGTDSDRLVFDVD